VESLDLKMIRAVGQNICDVVRSKTTLLEHMMKDDLLNRYYEGALGFPTYTRYLARMVTQLSHKNPHMNILEIGEFVLGYPLELVLPN
jgi:hybrid polyketide synthase/nonribosomal peptide synthetase ACE1